MNTYRAKRCSVHSVLAVFAIGLVTHMSARAQPGAPSTATVKDSKAAAGVDWRGGASSCL